ncbi:MAG: hypothetical protein FJW77_11260 [Actinobacteria bacterium]|nr:hypothetical protein [Actinomycetota bacterium]
MERWVLTLVWATLPLTAGGVLAEATADWSTAPRIVLAVLAWGAWAGGLLAVLVPRPVGLTALRAVAPAFLVGAVVAAWGVGGVAAAGAVVATAVAQVLVARPGPAAAAANASAYGDELRFPLRVPPGLFAGPVPLARLALAGAVTAGPLLLADRRIVAGVVALVFGIPLGVLAARALHSLSGRWAVLVPAGFVIVDPLTLADPVLFPRARIVALRPAPAATPLTPDGLDLRLGASAGGLELRLDLPAELYRTRRGGRATTTVRTTQILIAATTTGRLLAEASARAIPGTGQTASPPPTSSSPS